MQLARRVGNMERRAQSIKVSHRQLWYDLTKTGTPLKRLHKQPNILVQLWQKLKHEQQFQKLPSRKDTHRDGNLMVLSAPESVPPLWEEPEQLD